MPHSTIFKSFLQGGFEPCYALGEQGQRHDLLAATRHDQCCRADYRRLKSLGIHTVREGLAWHQIDDGSGQYDFSRFESLMRIAGEEGMEIIWSLNHFDLPEGADPLAPDFAERFADYAVAAVRMLRRHVPPKQPVYLIPFNEISFFSWIAGDAGLWYPYWKGQGFELKYRLAGASIAAMRRLRAMHLDVCFVHAEPLVWRSAAPGASPEAEVYAANFQEAVFQSWDMISGKICPELNGSPDLLDIVGINYYLDNQEEVLMVEPDVETGRPIAHVRTLDWDSPRRLGLDELLGKVWERYRRPMLVTETGSYGSLRLPWWQRTLTEVDRAMAAGLPLLGVCAYPVIDRPDWHQGHLTNSGFWDFDAEDGECQRRPHTALLDLIGQYQGQRPKREYPANVPVFAEDVLV